MPWVVAPQAMGTKNYTYWRKKLNITAKWANGVHGLGKVAAISGIAKGSFKQLHYHSRQDFGICA